MFYKSELGVSGRGVISIADFQRPIVGETVFMKSLPLKEQSKDYQEDSSAWKWVLVPGRYKNGPKKKEVWKRAYYDGKDRPYYWSLGSDGRYVMSLKTGIKFKNRKPSKPMVIVQPNGQLIRVSSMKQAATMLGMNNATRLYKWVGNGPIKKGPRKGTIIEYAADYDEGN